jgi:hypothetical protein
VGPVGLNAADLASATQVVNFVKTSSGGLTKSYVDEMGVFGCPAIDYDSVLDDKPGRFAFWNPRGAWFAVAYGQLASIGVEAMGASQFFGFDEATGAKNDWHGNTPTGHWYYPCLSALDWDTGLPNARYHVIKMIVDELGGSEMKVVVPATFTEPPIAPPPPPRNPATCKPRQTINHSDSFGGDLCEILLPVTATPADCVAACCNDPRCDYWVTIQDGPHWKPPCARKKACAAGDAGLCCYLKDGQSILRPDPLHRVGQMAGSVTPSAVTPPPSAGLVGFGFIVGGKKKLLLVNTGGLNVTGVVVEGAAGATHAFVDEAHGHGDIPPGRETLPSTGVLDVGGFGVAVISWP